MKDFVFVPLADFKRSEADGTYYIIDLNEIEVCPCDYSFTIDEVFEMRETPGIYIAYKEKSPCGNTD